METIIWTPGMSLAALEKMVILSAYQHFRRNKTATANSLGIAIRTLDNKLDQYNQESETEKKRETYVSEQRIDYLRRARGNPPNNIGMPYDPISAAREHNSSQVQVPYPKPSAHATAGVFMESVKNASSEPTMSMSERQEIQTVLPQSASSGNKGKRR